VVLAVAAASLSCKGEPDPPGWVVRDSAGVQVVESSSPQWGDVSPWTVDTVPVVDLAASGSGSPHDFMSVRDVRRLTDGRLVVLDEGLDEIRAFGPDGEFVTSLGREGDGPGEFRRPQRILPFRGDSIVVWDFWLLRITVLGPQLELGRVESARDAGVRLSRDLFWSGDSTFIGTEYRIDPDDQLLGHYRRPMQISRVSFESGRRDSLAMLAGFEGYSFERGDARPPFAKSSVAALRGTHVVAGDADAMEFRIHDSSGALRQIVRVPEYDLSIPPGQRARELEALLQPGAPPVLRSVRDQMAVPDKRPAYSTLRVDALGYLWASRYRAVGSFDGGEVWEVFSPEGAWMGSVGTPPRFEVFDIGSDYLTGVFRDDLDIEHPQVLSLSR